MRLSCGDGQLPDSIEITLIFFLNLVEANPTFALKKYQGSSLQQWEISSTVFRIRIFTKFKPVSTYLRKGYPYQVFEYLNLKQINMIENTILPHPMITVIGNEKKEFAVKAGRAHPTKRSIFVILFGTAWTAFTSIFVFAFLGPLFFGNEVHFESNGVPAVASPDNLEPIIVPALIIGIFVFIGLGMLVTGFYLLFKKGGYFVGTPTRLVQYKSKTVRSIDWEQFSGTIKVNGDVLKGNISLQLRTGRMVSSKNRPDRYVPDEIYISGIPDVFKIEQICRKRIKENDPTPATVVE